MPIMIPKGAITEKMHNRTIISFTE